MPGRLKYQIGGGPSSYLPVRRKIPGTYRARFQVASNPGWKQVSPKYSQYEWIDVADMALSNMVMPVILNQTNDHLVCATRLTPGYHINETNPPYLPFLWIMEKKEAAAAIKRAQAK
ncbi:MAG: hypothetical protein NTV46_17245 [Verrucomicrobia bacterium]|nr:hypothetical protein [Verrucomicrobiota bacterium]